MSQIYASAIALIIVNILGYFKIPIGTQEATAFVQSAANIALPIWIAYRRHQVGDIKVSGIKKDSTS